MNRDIRLSIGFIDHPKVMKLERRLSFEGVKCLIRLWSFAAQNKPDGVLSGMDEEDIELAAKWSGDHGAFFSAITDDKCLWLESSPEGFRLHDWDEHQGYVIHSQSRRDRARNAAAKKWQNEGSVSDSRKKRSERLSEARKKGTHTLEQWIGMKSFFEGTCVMCGGSEPEIELVKDHIIPLYQGGSDGIDNIQPLCRKCNASKGPDSQDYRDEAARALSKCLPPNYDACKTPAKTPAPSPAPDPSLKEYRSSSFCEFWDAYPRKVGKGQAERSWKKIKAPESTLVEILSALGWQKKSDQWTKNNGEFIPHPATYLNQRRWEDQPPEEKPVVYDWRDAY